MVQFAHDFTTSGVAGDPLNPADWDMPYTGKFALSAREGLLYADATSTSTCMAVYKHKPASNRFFAEVNLLYAAGSFHAVMTAMPDTIAATDAENGAWYSFRRNNDSTTVSTLALGKHSVNSTAITAKATTPQAPYPGGQEVLRIEYDEDTGTVRGYSNGVLMLTWVDPDPIKGQRRGGFRADGNATIRFGPVFKTGDLGAARKPIIQLPSLVSEVVGDYNPALVTSVAHNAALASLPDVNERPATSPATKEPIWELAPPTEGLMGDHPTVLFESGDYMSVLSHLTEPMRDRTVVMVFQPLTTADACFLDGEVFDRTTKIEQPSPNSLRTGKLSWFARDNRIDLTDRGTEPLIVIAQYGPGDVLATVNGVPVRGVMGPATDPFDRFRLGASNNLASFGPHRLARLTILRGKAPIEDFNALNEKFSQPENYNITVGAPLEESSDTVAEKFSALQDNFLTFDNSLWTDDNVNITAADGKLNIPALASYASTTTVERYDLVGSQVFIPTIQNPHLGAGTTAAGMLLSVDSNNQIEFSFVGGNLRMRNKVAGVWTTTDIPYDSVAHKYKRLREEEGTVLYETSADGESYVERGSWIPTFPITSLLMTLFAGFSGTETDPGTAIFGPLNVMPTVEVTDTLVWFVTGFDGVAQPAVLYIP